MYIIYTNPPLTKCVYVRMRVSENIVAVIVVVELMYMAVFGRLCCQHLKALLFMPIDVDGQNDETMATATTMLALGTYVCMYICTYHSIDDTRQTIHKITRTITTKTKTKTTLLPKPKPKAPRPAVYSAQFRYYYSNKIKSQQATNRIDEADKLSKRVFVHKYTPTHTYTHTYTRIVHSSMVV